MSSRDTTFTIAGIQFSREAAECIVETMTESEVLADVESLRAGYDIGKLTEHCLDGADDDRMVGWLEYVQAVQAAAGR